MKSLRTNKKGLSLIELILSISLFLVTLQVVYSIFFTGQKSFLLSKNIGFAQQDARIVTSFIQKELRPIKNMYIDLDDTTLKLDLSGEELKDYYIIGLNAENILTQYKSVDGIITTEKNIGSKIN